MLDAARQRLADGESMRSVASDLGVDRSNLVRRLKKAPEVATKSPGEDSSQMKKLIDALDSHLTMVKRAKARKLPKAPTRSVKGDLVRAIIPDSHGCYADPAAMAACVADVAALDPDEIVMLGDHVDCGGFLAAHHVLGYVAQMEYTYEDDIASCNAHLDALQKAAPRARIHYLEGNHEQRVERWCVGQALGSQKDADLLRRHLAPQFLLHLKERGITYYRRSEHYHGLPVPGVIRLGKCHFVHESAGGSGAAKKHADKFASSVVFGHTHRTDGVVVRKVATGEIGAWSPGCLSQLQPLWQHTHPTDWTHGYGLQIVAKSGLFQHINVTIANGRSCLGPLTKKLK
jgi:predicted phosphodiesterase